MAERMGYLQKAERNLYLCLLRFNCWAEDGFHCETVENLEGKPRARTGELQKVHQLTVKCKQVGYSMMGYGS